MTTDAVGGMWTYALDLAGGLTARGATVQLALLGPAPNSEQWADATQAGVDLMETGLPLEWTADRPEDVLAAGRALAALARETGIDLVHLNSPALAAGAAFDRPVVAWCHSCVATWWAAVRSGALPPDLAWRADLVRRGYDAAHALAAPSAAFALDTMAAYRLPRQPIVVHNGRLPFAALGGGEGVGAPTATDVQGEDAVFSAGRLWDEGKNIAALDRAAAQLPAPVFLAGPLNGPSGGEIVLSHARPLGRVTSGELARRLGARPVFASPARYEPFGLAVLEAAQAGCALVLSDIPTFRELWEGAAVFVPAEDDVGLSAALNGLLGDPARRDALGQAARGRASRYTVDRMVEGTLALYQTALSQRAAAA